MPLAVSGAPAVEDDEMAHSIPPESAQTPAESSPLPEPYAKFDTDKDGKLNAKELEAMDKAKSKDNEAPPPGKV